MLCYKYASLNIVTKSINCHISAVATGFFWGAGAQKDIKFDKLQIFYRVQIFKIQEKNTSYTRSETFHKVCIQGKGMYIDRSTYAYKLYLFPKGNENLFSSQSLHMLLYLLNLEFPLIITKIVPFSIMFDHCENQIIRI